jgi:hypothetical protein
MKGLPGWYALPETEPTINRFVLHGADDLVIKQN